MDNNTKIIATIGPACNNIKILQNMVNEGVNVFRLNMSHGDGPEKNNLLELVKLLKNKTKVFFF